MREFTKFGVEKRKWQPTQMINGNRIFNAKNRRSKFVAGCQFSHKGIGILPSMPANNVLQLTHYSVIVVFAGDTTIHRRDDPAPRTSGGDLSRPNREERFDLVIREFRARITSGNVERDAVEMQCRADDVRIEVGD